MRTKSLRPWVKIAMMFVLGVFVVSNIFTIFGADASTEKPENQILHGVVVLNINGESHLSILENYSDLVVEDKGYSPTDIVTVVMSKGKILNSYKTDREELKEIEENYKASIITIRRNVVEALYE